MLLGKMNSHSPSTSDQAMEASCPKILSSEPGAGCSDLSRLADSSTRNANMRSSFWVKRTPESKYGAIARVP